MTTSTPEKVAPLAITYADVTRLVGLSRRTLLRMIAVGKFPSPRRVGGRVLFDYQAVVAWWRKDGKC